MTAKTFLAVISAGLISVGLAFAASDASAQLTERNVSLATARVIADAAVTSCKMAGFDVTVAVVDKAGDVRILLRNDLANPHNAELARRKAYTSRTFRRPSLEWAKLTAGGAELAGQRELADVIPLGGGMPIAIGTETIGAVGVSGATSQEADEACAKAGLAAAANLLR